jgi:hypothetical protein
MIRSAHYLNSGRLLVTVDSKQPVLFGGTINILQLLYCWYLLPFHANFDVIHRIASEIVTPTGTTEGICYYHNGCIHTVIGKKDGLVPPAGPHKSAEIILDFDDQTIEFRIGGHPQGGVLDMKTLRIAQPLCPFIAAPPSFKCSLHVATLAAKYRTLSVNNLNTIFQVDALPSDTVATIKGRIHKQFPNYRPDQFQLVTSGRIMDNNTTLATYYVLEGGSVHLQLISAPMTLALSRFGDAKNKDSTAAIAYTGGTTSWCTYNPKNLMRFTENNTIVEMMGNFDG